MLPKADVPSFEQFYAMSRRIHICHNTNGTYKTAGNGFGNAVIDAFAKTKIVSSNQQLFRKIFPPICFCEDIVS